MHAMRALVRTFVGWGVALAIAGCGGATPPADTSGTPPPGTGAPPADTASLPPGPEPASTPELDAGIKAFDAGNYADARKSFEAATRKAPTNFEAFFDLGQACEKLGDKTAAEAAYKGALAVKPELDAAAAALGTLYIDAGRFDEAVDVTKAGLAKRPGSVPLHENLGVALAAKGDQDGARSELEQAAKLAPGDAMTQLTLAHWLNAWHVHEAKPHLDLALQAAKDDYGMLASIGLEYRMAGEFDACIKALDHAVQIKDGGEVRTTRALCKLGSKDEKGCLDDLQAAVAAEPSYAQAHYYLGGRLASGHHYKEAVAEYAKYLQLAPSGSLAKAAAERMKLAQDAAKSPKKK
jgi:tetratricopeptide (TPR) repeat protein